MSDDMPKRARENDPSGGPTSPPRGSGGDGSASSAPSAGRNPQVEALLARLDMDDDFKDSIRALSPTSQREVLNDIVRQQQQEQAATLLAGGDSAYTGGWQQHGGRGAEYDGMDPMLGFDEDDTDDFEDIADDDDSDYRRGDVFGRQQGQRGERGGNARAGFPQLMMFDRGDGQLRPGLMIDVPAGEDAPPPMTTLVQQVLPNLIAQLGQQRQAPQPGAYRGGGAGGLQEMLRQHLMSVLGELQQVSAMREMGLDRDIDDMSYEELLALEERLGSVSKGLDSEAKMEACFDHQVEAPSEGSCPICLDEFAPTSGLTTPAKQGTAAESGKSADPTSRASSVAEVRPCVSLKNCGHVFHESCIKTWLRSDKTCPVCKQEVIAQP